MEPIHQQKHKLHLHPINYPTFQATDACIKVGIIRFWLNDAERLKPITSTFPAKVVTWPRKRLLEISETAPV